ncbi:MAG TPA: prepilin-type N-terminal cleavage/methylation domain-containing protein [Aliidongia sp.]|nr:prepilin-type N-terminal cleavage/methylation domain-containing protein [Aliidongia sp.]
MRGEKGFTLLELLVALAVLGLLMAGLVQGVRLGIVAWNRQSSLLQSRSELDATDRVLRQLLTRIDPGTGRGPIRIEGNAHQLDFRSELPTAVATSTRRADMSLLVDDRNRLILRWKPYFHENELGTGGKETDTVLLDHVEQLNLSYWGGQDNGGAGAQSLGWITEWTTSFVPPLIKLQVKFPDGDRRHWPDIVVAPLLEQPGG